jgi:hypothetical protein
MIIYISIATSIILYHACNLAFHNKLHNFRSSRDGLSLNLGPVLAESRTERLSNLFQQILHHLSAQSNQSTQSTLPLPRPVPHPRPVPS